ncbi:endonuclease domain-containing protein [Erythrobacter sp. NE805]|uniref:endonuclease domain-containing protein n=1 Tax=Erythrobacter sp. NE805 TaxID=3389875 RepID=UPI00396AF944
MRKSDHNYTLARAQRKTPSLPEGLLWRELRAARGGLKFRRQHPVGPYVLDFSCAAAKCGFEIDGMAHEMGDRPALDERRDVLLAAQEIRVKRIPASEVLADPSAVAKAMVRLCAGIIAGDA